jgi:hypothetical protein
LFKQDLSEATVVSCYLQQYTNLQLEAKFKQELGSGCRVVTNTFPFLGLAEVSQDGEVRLYRM